MPTVPDVVYRIDREDRIAEVNDGWLAFAAANRGQELQPAHILGRTLWDFLADDTTKHLYQAMVRRLRHGGLPVRFRFRCDSPSRRRLLSMEITSDHAGGARFRVTSVLEDPRPSIALLDPMQVRDGRLLAICGWCKQIRLPAGDWVEVEEAVRVLGLFARNHLPGLTHGICPPCYSAIVGTLQDPALEGADIATVGETPSA